VIQSFNGKAPRIADSAFVSKAAHVIGDVEIGENCVVMPGAVLRGDFGKIKVGDNSVVEDNCVIHSGSLTEVRDIVIGENVVLGHGAVDHAVRVGNNALIRINAVLLHDAEIGDSCIIAAGAVVEQGAKIPDRSFVVGIPGRVKKEVSREQLEWMELGAQVYMELAKWYKKEGF